MMISTNLRVSMDELLREYFEKDLEDLIEKYIIIEQKNLEKLKELSSKLEGMEISEGIHRDIDVAILLANEPRFNIVEIYLWLRKNMNISDLEKARRIIDYLEAHGYIEYNGYLFTYKDADLEDYYRDLFLEVLEDSYYVEQFFTKDRLAEMWTEKVCPVTAAEELLEVEDPLYELLDIRLEETYIFKDGKTLMIAEIDY